MTWCSFGLYFSSFTPITNIWASAEGAEMMTCGKQQVALKVIADSTWSSYLKTPLRRHPWFWRSSHASGFHYSPHGCAKVDMSFVLLGQRKVSIYQKEEVCLLSSSKLLPHCPRPETDKSKTLYGPPLPHTQLIIKPPPSWLRP